MKKLKILIAGILFYLGFSLVVTLTLLHKNTYKRQRHFSPPLSPNFGKEIILKTRDGLRISGWLLEGDIKKSILIVHGLSRSKFDREVNIFEFAKELNNLGYTVLLIDLRSHGSSEGNFIGAGFLERYDVAAGVEFLKKRNSKVIVIGFSMGAAAAILAYQIAAYDGLVVDSCYLKLDKVAEKAIEQFVCSKCKYVYKFFKPFVKLWAKIIFDVESYEISESIKKIPFPVLIIYGEFDTFVSADEMKEIFRNAPVGSRLWIFPAPHVRSFIYFRKDYLLIVESYAKERFSSRDV